MEIIKNNWKRYLISSVVTFITAFLIAILPNLQTLDIDTLGISALIGVFGVGARAGIKALSELVMAKLNNK